MLRIFALITTLALVPVHASNSLPTLSRLVGNYNPADGTPAAETSIVVDQTGTINLGKPITITFSCGDEVTWPPTGANIPTLIIRDEATRTILKQVVWPNGGYRGFAIKQTINGLIHIFATQDPSSSKNVNTFVHSTIDATFIPSTGVALFTPGLYGSNNQLTAGFASPNPAGGWSINYANVNQHGVGFFDWPDSNFTPGGYTNVPSGQLFTVTNQSAAADYNSVDGHWYTWVQNLQYNTNGALSLLWVTMARSTDRVNWTYSPTILMFPDMPALDGIDASDVRMVEYQGQMIIISLCGNQSTSGAIRIATFPGTLVQLYAQFF